MQKKEFLRQSLETIVRVLKLLINWLLCKNLLLVIAAILVVHSPYLSHAFRILVVTYFKDDKTIK